MALTISNTKKYLAILLAAGVAAIVVSVSAIAGDDDAAEKLKGKQIGDQLLQAEERSVAVVNGIPLTHARFRVARESVNYNISLMNEQLNNSNLPSEFADDIGGRLEMMNRAGLDNVVLGTLIAEVALESLAASGGHVASESQIESRIAEHRIALDAGESPVNTGFADSLGEQYWLSYLPELYRREISVENLFNATVENATSEIEASQLWGDLTRYAVDTAIVEITDAALIGDATIESALEYFRLYSAR